MRYGVEEHFENYCESKVPLFFPGDADPLCEGLGRRAAYALFEQVSEQLFEWDGLVTTLQLVMLPEYAFMGNRNLEVYNRFLLVLSERGLLPIKRARPDAFDSPTDDWLWEIDDKANAKRAEEEEVYD